MTKRQKRIEQNLEEPDFVSINEMVLRGAYGSTLDSVIKEATAEVERFP